MNYQLAKALMQAGFPQKGAGGYVSDPANIVDKPLYSPTLEELIEACGVDFKCLNKYLNDTWDAKHANGHDFDGTTPAEAVARLWISSQENRPGGHYAIASE